MHSLRRRRRFIGSRWSFFRFICRLSGRFSLFLHRRWGRLHGSRHASRVTSALSADETDGVAGSGLAASDETDGVALHGVAKTNLVVSR